MVQAQWKALITRTAKIEVNRGTYKQVPLLSVPNYYEWRVQLDMEEFSLAMIVELASQSSEHAAVQVP